MDLLSSGSFLQRLTLFLGVTVSVVGGSSSANHNSNNGDFMRNGCKYLVYLRFNHNNITIRKIRSSDWMDHVTRKVTAVHTSAVIITHCLLLFFSSATIPHQVKVSVPHILNADAKLKASSPEGAVGSGAPAVIG